MEGRNLASTQRRGLVVIIALAVLTVIEFVVAVALAREAAVPLLVLVALAKGMLIVDYFMHITQLWRREE